MPLNTYLGYVIALILLIILSIILFKQFEQYNLQKDPILVTLKQILEPVDPIVQNLKLYKGNKSYTINKEKVFLCLYDKDGKYYPLNMLIYVLLHEIAHILNDKDIGHTENFYIKFDELLKRAENLNIYNSKIPPITDYCGQS